MISISDKLLKLNEFNEIVFKGKAIALDPSALKKVEKNHFFISYMCNYFLLHHSLMFAKGSF